MKPQYPYLSYFARCIDNRDGTVTVMKSYTDGEEETMHKSEANEIGQILCCDDMERYNAEELNGLLSDSWG